MNTILRKLLYKGQTPVLIVGMPESYARLAKEMRAEIHDHPKEKYAFVQIFAHTLSEAKEQIKKAIKGVDVDTYLWFCYPKGTSKSYYSDLNRQAAWPLFAEYEYEPVTQVSIDDDWTALRFRHVDRIKTLRRKVAATKKGQERIDSMDNEQRLARRSSGTGGSNEQ